jgi:hypothetical protein
MNKTMVIGLSVLLLAFGLIGYARAGCLEELSREAHIWVLVSHSASMKEWTIDSGNYDTPEDCQKVAKPGETCIEFFGEFPSSD